MPLIDRPFLQHVVESVAESGVADTIDVVLSDFPERVEELLGDGTRWGIKIRYHLARDVSRPYAALSRIAGDDPILLIHADCLPWAPLRECAVNSHQLAICHEGTWTGWAILDAAVISGIGPEWDRARLTHFLIDEFQPRVTVYPCPIVIGVRSEMEFINSQRAALAKRFPGLMFYGREVDEGIWIGRNVTLHPTAKLIPPVYLGENCRIDEGVLLGPNVVVVRDCVLDSSTTVVDSTILPGSYIGQALELDHVIVDRNRLINVKAGGEVIVHDDFILSGITSTSFRTTLINLLSRTAATVLLLFTWPVILITALCLLLFRKGPVSHPVLALRLPAPEDHWGWKTFSLAGFARPGSNLTAWEHLFLRFLPGLLNVVRGHLHLVGVAPRSAKEVLALPGDWRMLYLRARAGLITEAFALHGSVASSDEIYTCEAYYSVAAGPVHDGRVFLRYLAQLFRPHHTTDHSELGGANLDLK